MTLGWLAVPIRDSTNLPRSRGGDSVLGMRVLGDKPFLAQQHFGHAVPALEQLAFQARVASGAKPVAELLDIEAGDAEEPASPASMNIGAGLAAERSSGWSYGFRKGSGPSV